MKEQTGTLLNSSAGTRIHQPLRVLVQSLWMKWETLWFLQWFLKKRSDDNATLRLRFDSSPGERFVLRQTRLDPDLLWDHEYERHENLSLICIRPRYVCLFLLEKLETTLCLDQFIRRVFWISSGLDSPGFNLTLMSDQWFYVKRSLVLVQWFWTF